MSGQSAILMIVFMALSDLAWSDSYPQVEAAILIQKYIEARLATKNVLLPADK